jgi:hypothetical protein
MKIVLLSVFALLALQQNPANVVQDSRVKELVAKHVEYNKVSPVNGFRINIFSQSGNNSRGAAVAAQTAFTEIFPYIKSYMTFEEPHFKIKVGNYRTRLEAAHALERVQIFYPQAFIVRDALDVKDLLGVEPVVLKED